MGLDSCSRRHHRRLGECQAGRASQRVARSRTTLAARQTLTGAADVEAADDAAEAVDD